MSWMAITFFYILHIKKEIDFFHFLSWRIKKIKNLRVSNYVLAHYKLLSHLLSQQKTTLIKINVLINLVLTHLGFDNENEKNVWIVCVLQYCILSINAPCNHLLSKDKIQRLTHAITLPIQLITVADPEFYVGGGKEISLQDHRWGSRSEYFFMS